MKNSKQKIKVVWLCYFTNNFVQDQLKPTKRIDEFAPWISSLIKLFENSNDIELHVVSQHKWISGYKSFENNSVYYHFYNAGIPVIGRQWPGFFELDLWTDFYAQKSSVKKIIKKVNPDIIHLHGAENDFSASALQFHKKYPVFVTVQGFIHQSSFKSKRIQNRIDKEFEVYNTFNHIGFRTETMGKEIKKINSSAKLLWHDYPLKPITPLEVSKKYDLVFFARLSRDKGIHDLLKALSIIKTDRPEISLCVMGGGKTDALKQFADELNISDNIYWAGFLPTQDDVHRLASQAKISVLPTYHDIISGTIIESLFLKLPVVAYNAGSIHEVNKNEEIISLVEIGDVNGLVKVIQQLLADQKLLKEKADKGFERVFEMFGSNNDKVKKDLLNAYNIVINDFKNQIN